jgi:hypothetical protein
VVEIVPVAPSIWISRSLFSVNEPTLKTSATRYVWPPNVNCAAALLPALAASAKAVVAPTLTL